MDAALLGHVRVTGSSGEDTLAGPAADTIWNVTGHGSGSVAGATFTGIENLSGAADNEDTFIVRRAVRSTARSMAARPASTAWCSMAACSSP